MADSTLTHVDQETAWDAVNSRDADYDGRFVYAVKTTGIYCRPTCPSRRPKRVNVDFFKAPQMAEDAGFRPCQRCTPERPSTPAGDLIARAVARLDAHLRDQVETPLTLEQLAKSVGASPYHLQRTFKAAMGVSPKQYLDGRRQEELRSQLTEQPTVTDAIYAAGYGSGSRVYEKTDVLLGMTPSIYQRGGAGQKIRYALVACSLGRLLVAATERGVCAVSLGDDDESLENELRREFPQAFCSLAEDGLEETVQAVLASLEGREPSTTLAVDLRGTAFQLTVWNALRQIPSGTTASYKDVAKAIGRPKSARAVAQACAANRVAVVVPCHRVVRSDGSAGGYRWGEQRKERLLRGEDPHHN